MRNAKMRAGRKIALAAAAAALAAAAAAIASETISYSYDARGRLVRVDHAGTVNANVVTNYIYDKADNRIVRNTTGVP
jgi:YD repeat-containing protein